MENLKIADSKGEYTTTCKIILELSGKGKKTSVKINKRYVTPPTSETDPLSEWRKYFSSLLNNNNSQSPSVLPSTAAQDLTILTNTPTRDETLSAIHQMKTNKAAGLDSAITPEAHQNSGDAMLTLSMASVQNYTPVSRHPTSGPSTNVTVPLPKKGDLR